MIVPLAPNNSLQGIPSQDLIKVTDQPLSWKTKWTAGQGDCQFIAFARAIGKVTHSEVRQKAVSWMRTHPDEYAPFKPPNLAYSTYLNRMAKPKAWGDNLTLQAMSMAYKAQVFVLKEGDNGEKVWLEGGKTDNPVSVFWVYLHQKHYENLLGQSQVE